MVNLRLLLCFVLVAAGCNRNGPTSPNPGSERLGSRSPESSATLPARDDSNASPQNVIRVGDSLDSTVKKLREHRITISDATPAVDWADGKDRRLYRLSRSRSKNDALVLVSLREDGGESAIEEMYWDIDFIKQHVPKSDRPEERHEAVESVDILQLNAELTGQTDERIDDGSNKGN